MEYETVFKVVDEGFSILYLIPFAFIIFGILMIWFALKKIRDNPQQKAFLIIFSFVFILFALTFIFSEVSDKWVNRNRFKNIFENNKYEIAEGEIENFKKMSFRGDYCKEFTVDGAYFECHPSRCLDLLYRTYHFSGHFKENKQKVRISYIKMEKYNRIIKIELKQ